MDTREKFAAELYPAALQVSRETGVSADLMVAQAARETNWGQHLLPGSNNPFGLKVDGNWSGPRQSSDGIEYIDGERTSVQREFRVYGSMKEGLQDWVESLRQNPRVSDAGLFAPGVLGNFAQEAQALQDARYSTDPQFAAQLRATLDSPTMKGVLRESSLGALRDGSDAGALLVTDAGHPAHGLFQKLGAGLEKELGYAPNPAVVAGLTLQAVKLNYKDDRSVAGIYVAGSDVMVAGAMGAESFRTELAPNSRSIAEVSKDIDALRSSGEIEAKPNPARTL